MSILLTVLMWVGIGIGGLIVCYGLWALTIALVPMKSVKPQPRRKSAPKRELRLYGKREDVFLEVKGKKLAAWFHLPEKGEPPYPCIVMAHGLGGTRHLGLAPRAARLQREGFAVLAFDYRCLGDSEGEPRQLVWIPYQQEDWRAAIAYARNREEVDADRVGLWGSSLSGGHVVQMASEDERIGCVAAQVPLIKHSQENTGEVIRQAGGWGWLLKLAFVHALRDLMRSRLGLSPHRVPLLGPPGTMAALPDEGAWRLYEESAPDDFVNQICARIMLRMNRYEPIKRSATIRCPVMLGIADNDIGTTPESVVADAERRLGKLCETRHYPTDHFGIYTSGYLEKSISDQVDFYRRHLMS